MAVDELVVDPVLEPDNEFDESLKRESFFYVRGWWSIPCGGAMLRLNVLQFYRLGRAIRLIERVDGEKRLIDVMIILHEPEYALKDFLAQQQLGFLTARQPAKELLGHITGIVTPRKTLTEEDLNSPVRPIYITKLKEALARFEAVLEAELASRTDIYSVSDKGAYNTAILIERADSVIPERLRALLPDVARYDLKQSGRCLAFEVPTAAGFHALRAAEAVMKKYYEKLAGKSWPHTQRDWGRYINELRGLNAPERIVSAIEQTKANYRNPLMHPEVTLEIEEAIGLFGMVSSLLSMMLQEIEK